MFRNIKVSLAMLPLLLAASAVTAAAQSPVGTWIDHTGRGAVEIYDCGAAVCGKIVWLKDAGDQEVCNTQVIGDLKAVSGGKWDGGWIYDPEKRAKYDLELTPQGEKLKVLGYLRTKMMGETMMWTRAPANLRRCGTPEAAKPETARPDQARPDQQPPVRQAEPAPQPEATQPPEPSRDAKSDSPMFEQREVRGKGKECTINVPDLGKFTFPC